MSTSRRKKAAYHHGDLSAAILRAAEELLEEQGVEGLKLRALARRAKVSHSAPNRHFPNRDSLLAALAAGGFARLGRAQQEARAAGGLRAMGEAYIAFALQRPQLFRLMFGGSVEYSKHPALGEVATRVFQGLSGALAGERDASIAAWALVHGLASLLLGDRISVAARQGRDQAAFARDVISSVRFVTRVA
jgi:AcrR family transcriptional regulator